MSPLRLRRWCAFALALLAVGACGRGGDEMPDTGATTRALLGGPVEGGPSTLVRGSPGLSAGAQEVNVMELGYNRGVIQAPLKIIEFSDFGCGFCRRFHQESFPTLIEEFIETGKIEWKFMPFITGNFENSLAVTEAAECALEQSPALYEAIGGELWTRQSEWKESDEPEALVREWAREAGVELPRFDSCLAEDRRMNRVRGANAVADQLGIRATPTLWLVGFGPVQGALPLETFRGILGTIYEEIVADSGTAAPPPAN
ncbi:MAG: DsbA family protein [Gemmatimonadales bacterium]